MTLGCKVNQYEESGPSPEEFEKNGFIIGRFREVRHLHNQYMHGYGGERPQDAPDDPPRGETRIRRRMCS